MAKAFDTVWIDGLLYKLTRLDTSRKPTLLVSYLGSYLNDIQRWLRDWKIVINVSKSTAIILACARRHFVQPRPLALFGDTIEWVDTTRYLGDIQDRPLIWSPHIYQIRRKTAHRMGLLCAVLNRSDLYIKNGVQLYKHLIRPEMD